MKCLVCKDTDLKEHEIVTGLKTHHCHDCCGNWLRLGDYIEWHTHNHLVSDDKNTTNSYLEVNDSTNPKLCPDCSRILTVYKISNNLKLRLEHCAFCNGIWFDKNEWETLKENNLHDKIDKFFTDSWQKNLRDEERRTYFENFYTRKFGTEDYTKIKQIREWLDNSENKSMLLAYLMNKDPYKL